MFFYWCILFKNSFSYIAANLGGILQAALSINGMLGGPTFAIFLLAYFNPWSEWIGLLSGYFFGLALSVWCYIGSTQYPPLPEFTKRLDTEISGCQGYPGSLIKGSFLVRMKFAVGANTKLENAPTLNILQLRIFSIRNFI